MKYRFMSALIALLLLTLSFSASAAPPYISDSMFGCDQPVTDVRFYPNTQDPVEWKRFVERDVANQACAGQRGEDQFRHKELHQRYLEQMPQDFQRRWLDQLGEPNRLRLTTAQMIPGAGLGDPFRIIEDWQAMGRGHAVSFSFISSRRGSRVVGDLFLPPTSVSGPRPGVIIAPGASQHQRQLYYWSAQGLAEEGYQVMIFDFPDEGESESVGHNPDSSACTTQTCILGIVPGDLYYSFDEYYSVMRDAVSFFFSTPDAPFGAPLPNYTGTNWYNPEWSRLDRSKVGVAGHSVGSLASSDIGQKDQRIKAVVRWGNTGVIGPDYLSNAHAPTLILADEYGPKGPQPWFTLPPQGIQELGYDQLVALQLPTMLINLRSSTHFEWTYGPGRYASRYGERVSFYYTLGWLDAFLKGATDNAIRDDAYARLTAREFDDSSDLHSIGAGLYNEDDPSPHNLPYMIEGIPVPNRLSYIYRSRFWLKGGAVTCDDMRVENCLTE